MVHDVVNDDFTDDLAKVERDLGIIENLLVPGPDDNVFVTGGRLLYAAGALAIATVTFPLTMTLFILEEAAQTTALPTTILLQQRRYAEAKSLAELTKRTAELGARLTGLVAAIAPLNGPPFGAFFHSAWSSALAMIDLADEGLARQALAPTAKLRITSAPSDAAVILDGAGTALRTPATLEGLSLGPHTVTASRVDRRTDQLLTASATVQLDAGPTRELRIELPKPTAAAAAGPRPPESRTSLRIESRPPNAAITIDDTELRLLTPETIKGIPAGPHRVQLLLRDAATGLPRRAEGDVDVPPDGRTEILLDLPPVEPAPEAPAAPRPTRVALGSLPAGAAITVDGVPTAFLTPETLIGLEPGPHRIDLVRDDGRPEGPATGSLQLELTPGAKVEHLVRLTRPGRAPRPPPPQPTTGRLRLTSQPTNAEIILDGRPTQLRTPETFDGVPPGTHDVELRHVNARTKKPMRGRRRFTIGPGQPLEIHVTLIAEGP